MHKTPQTLIAIITLLMFYNSLFSQDVEKKCHFGFQVAPAGSTLLGNYKDRREFDYNIRCRFGYVGGINFQYQVKPKFALCFEANYESKGATFIFHNMYNVAPDGGAGNSSYLGTVRIISISDYITTPVTAKLTISKNKVLWFTKIGTYPSYLLRSGIRDYPVHGALGEVHYNHPRNIIINMGLLTSIGFNTIAGKRSQFTMEARNNINLFTIGNDIKFNKHATTLDSFALLVGFSFKI